MHILKAGKYIYEPPNFVLQIYILKKLQSTYTFASKSKKPTLPTTVYCVCLIFIEPEHFLKFILLYESIKPLIYIKVSKEDMHRYSNAISVIETFSFLNHIDRKDGYLKSICIRI